MTDYKLSYTTEDLKRQEMELRDNLYQWAIMTPVAPGSTPAKITNVLGVEMTYIEMGSELRSRLDAILQLQEANRSDVFRAEEDRAHLGAHQEQGKPLENWELELMGLRKVADMKFEVVCYSCADKRSPSAFFGKKLEWLPANGTELVTQMHLEFAVHARDSHLDTHGDHTVSIELV